MNVVNLEIRVRVLLLRQYVPLSCICNARFASHTTASSPARGEDFDLLSLRGASATWQSSFLSVSWIDFAINRAINARWHGLAKLYKHLSSRTCLLLPKSIDFVQNGSSWSDSAIWFASPSPCPLPKRARVKLRKVLLPYSPITLLPLKRT